MNCCGVLVSPFWFCTGILSVRRASHVLSLNPCCTICTNSWYFGEPAARRHCNNLRHVLENFAPVSLFDAEELVPNVTKLVAIFHALNAPESRHVYLGITCVSYAGLENKAKFILQQAIYMLLLLLELQSRIER